MADRDVEINLIGRNRLSASTRAAARDLEKLAAKVDRLEHKLNNIHGGKIKIKTKTDVDNDKFKTLGKKAGDAFARAMGNAVADGTRALGNAIRVGLLKGGPGVQVAGAILGARIVGFIGQAITAGLGLFIGPALLAAPIGFLLYKQLKAAKEVEKSEKRIAALKKRLEATKNKDTQARIQKELEGERRILRENQKQAALIDRLKSRAKDFLEFISQPLKIPFADALDAVGDGLERLKKPMREITTALGPALAPFTKGVMGLLVNFIKGLEPALPGIVAGMREWGKQMPKIGAALGDMVSKILKDPDKVVVAIQQVSGAIQGLASFAGSVVSGLTSLGNAFYYIDAAAEALDTKKFADLATLPEVDLGPFVGSFQEATRAIIEETAIWTRRLDDFLQGIVSIPGTPFDKLKNSVHESRIAVDRELEAFNSNYVKTQQETAKKPMIIKVEADINKAKTRIAELRAKLLDPNLSKKRRIQIEAKIDAAEAKIKRLKIRLAALQATKTVPRVQARIDQAEAKLAVLKRKLKQTHDSKTRAKIKGDIKQAEATIARLKRELKAIRDEEVKINVRTQYYGGDKVPTNPKGDKNAAMSWGGALNGGDMHRTQPPAVNVAPPNVSTLVKIDGKDLAAAVRTVIADENRKSTHRARVGRRN